MKMSKKKEGRFVCKCECGGSVRGVEQFDRLWTWCEQCTPVVTLPSNPVTPANTTDVGSPILTHEKGE